MNCHRYKVNNNIWNTKHKPASAIIKKRNKMVNIRNTMLVMTRSREALCSECRPFCLSCFQVIASLCCVANIIVNFISVTVHFRWRFSMSMTDKIDLLMKQNAQGFKYGVSLKWWMVVDFFSLTLFDIGWCIYNC